MVRLTGTFSRLCSRKVLVIGDLMLDTYTIGKARRISPEAPVAVIQVTHEESRPGGAGNVMLNLISMGAEVVAVGRIGQDPAGETLRQALIAEKIDVKGLVVQNNLKTPVKNRIIAENQQIVRVDHEQVTAIPEMLEQEIIEKLPELLEGVSVVAISDYGKGFLSRTLLTAVIEQANNLHIPIIADPKGNDFTKYSGTTIIKPNLSEAYAASGFAANTDLDTVAEKILKIAQAQSLMITRSESGISLFHSNGKREDFPVKVKEVKDVTGAGDTVLAMLTCAIASGLPIDEAVKLSNVAAGMAIERLGCARITLSELARRLLENDVVNKVFDDEHLYALQSALQGRKYTLLGLSGESGMTSSAFAAIRKLSRNTDCDLLVYLIDTKPDNEFVELLSSIHEVKFIILHCDNLCRLVNAIHPEKIYAVIGKEMKQLNTISNILELTPR
ncbi:MAG: D-glycero-beta-D-manno-heptose-7-phosphate kinase [Parachlamydiaceae bacterium]|nr:D-glycero-beta-D-manno-heptose-7-phosphate kinase [Parachlamydiaceae bacterium]